jgi:hypothetical protein
MTLALMVLFQIPCSTGAWRITDFVEPAETGPLSLQIESDRGGIRTWR